MIFSPKFSCFKGHFCCQIFFWGGGLKNAQPTDPTWQVRPPVRQGFPKFPRIESGKKMTEGIATNPVTESLAVSANAALSWDFGLRHIALWMLPLNYALGSYGPGPLHSLGEVWVPN